MKENKTKPTQESVRDFLDGVSEEARRKDCYTILELMQEVSGEEPKMWGSSIVGFGNYHYKYASGREGDSLITGFSPRKRDLTLYITSGFDDFDELMSRLGKYKTGKACLYIKKVEDIDLPTLKELVSRSVEHMRKTNS
jgi:hypothetical protein